MDHKYKNILVAIDGSEQSEKAFYQAVTIADRNDSTLQLLTVIDTSIFSGMQSEFNGILDYFTKKTEEKFNFLETELQNLSETKPLQMNSEFLYGNPKQEIVRYAKEKNSDLIVIGATGKGTINRMLIGSTSSYVVNSAPCNVLVVR